MGVSWHVRTGVLRDEHTGARSLLVASAVWRRLGVDGHPALLSSREDGDSLPRDEPPGIGWPARRRRSFAWAASRAVSRSTLVSCAFHRASHRTEAAYTRPAPLQVGQIVEACCEDGRVPERPTPDSVRAARVLVTATAHAGPRETTRANSANRVQSPTCPAEVASAARLA